MKALFLLIAAVLMASTAFTQTSNPCVSCNNNVIDTANYSSAIGSENISTGLNSLAGGIQSQATGEYSLAFGKNNIANQRASFAVGENTEANGMYSIAMGFGCKSLGNMGVAMGFFAEANSSASIALGKSVKTSGTSSFVLGRGYDEQLLENSIGYSLMIGINSTVPTLFIGPSIGGPTRTGKMGIGNITNPEAKLHIKADINEDASIMLQPTESNYYAKLLFGENGHQIYTKAGDNFSFSTSSGKDFVFENGNLGVDTENPIAKVHIKNGDIFIEDIDRGIVMKSPDGSCWRGTLDNSGMLNFVQVNCNDLLTGSLDHSDRMTKRVNIYPNPTGSKLFISIDQELTGAILEITNINGKIQTTKVLSNQESCIDMSSYSKGIYIYTVKNNTGIIDTGKVVKE